MKEPAAAAGPLRAPASDPALGVDGDAGRCRGPVEADVGDGRVVRVIRTERLIDTAQELAQHFARACFGRRELLLSLLRFVGQSESDEQKVLLEGPSGHFELLQFLVDDGGEALQLALIRGGHYPVDLSTDSKFHRSLIHA